MGKRNKAEQRDNDIKMKKKKLEKDKLPNDDLIEETSVNVESSGNGKNKKILFDNDESSKMATVKNSVEANSTSSLKRSRNKNTKRNKKGPPNKIKLNKKIIFTDDNDVGTEFTQNIARSNKNGTEECAEEEPGDEEIDKFCDALDEEDNVHYDNWVKLIESKLCPNKKK